MPVMDHSCRDIPMKLDINHQPLNFDIYLSQVIDVPRTPSLELPPYDFKLELEALERVEEIIKREQEIEGLKNKAALGTDGREEQILIEQNIPPFYDSNVTLPVTPTGTDNSQKQQQQQHQSEESSATNQNAINQINPREFEDMHYNPFDQLELQTIDELKELDLVFQQNKT